MSATQDRVHVLHEALDKLVRDFEEETGSHVDIEVKRSGPKGESSSEYEGLRLWVSSYD